MKKVEIAAAVPAMGTSALPILSCPACWPAYASMLSAVGLSFLGESIYLLWLNAAALLVSLAVLFRRGRSKSYAPFLMGVIASSAILLGKFLLNSNVASWLGAAILLVAFVWSGTKSEPVTSCQQCVTKTSLEVESNGIKES